LAETPSRDRTRNIEVNTACGVVSCDAADS